MKITFLIPNMRGGGAERVLHNLLNKMIADHTGQKIDKVTNDTERDNFMSAAEALKYGLIDHVVKAKS